MSIPTISTGDDVAVGDIGSVVTSTGTIPILSTEDATVDQPAPLRSFTNTGAIPVIA